MLELLLIRHGQTEWNVMQKVMGRQPIPLSDRGRAQAEALSDYLSEAKLSAVISSPVLRAMQTAGIVASRHDGIEVEPDEGLSEIDYGEWVNLTFAELTEKHGETWRRYREDPNDLVLPGGESMPEVAARVKALVDRVRARFPEGRVALVSHADVIKLVLIELIGLDIKHILRLSIDNCSMLLVRVREDTGARLIMYNPQNGFGNDMRFSSSKGGGTEV